jgi:endo-1,4-beta-xylanase
MQGNDDAAAGAGWVRVRGSSRRAFLERAARVGAGAAAGAVMPLAGCARRAVGVARAGMAPAAGAQASVGAAAEEVAGAESLGEHAAARGVLYGCAVEMNALKGDGAYAEVIREQCRIVVAENAMKWGALRPSAETFSFDEADALLVFAEANEMKLRGHNLAWHQYNPGWLDATATATNARGLLVKHIETVVGRYAGRMHSWDVVNEAIDIGSGRADGLRNSVWLRTVGEEYIEVAFRTAREADPRALLTYNDYGVEAETLDAERKRVSVLEMLRRMVARKVPVDAMGVQSHIADMNAVGTAPGEGLMRFMASVRELGLQVFITEMDVNDRADGAVAVRDAVVAEAYRQYLELVLREPAVRAVLTWGITDRYTWLDSEGPRDGLAKRPLPFDGEYRAAMAFFAMREAFDGRGRQRLTTD